MYDQPTRMQLIQAFCDRHYIRILHDGSVVEGVISSLAHEDGSGFSFVVELEGLDGPFYVRAADHPNG